MELSNFPLASDADCQWLKQELSGLPCHCPYIFDNCRLPDGCQPDQAGVLLRREVGRYSMELDRPVQYRGRNRAMKVLARGTPVFFQDFSEMVRFFRALPEKRLGTGPPAGAEEPVVAMGRKRRSCFGHRSWSRSCPGGSWDRIMPLPLWRSSLRCM